MIKRFFGTPDGILIFGLFLVIVIGLTAFLTLAGVGV
jgi:hypothetical protein